MKKFLLMITAFALLAVSCDPNSKEPKTADVTVSLITAEGTFAKADVTVIVRDNNSSAFYEAKTNEEGVAAFKLPSGLYSASASYRENSMTVYNGLNPSITAVAGNVAEYKVEMKSSRVSQVIIKEIYVGGCPDNDGAKTFLNDSYMILYNNTDVPADASDICIAFINPMNAFTPNKYMVEGKLKYEGEGWLPAGYAIWWFDSAVEIPPYSQIVVAMRGAIDHTQTYTNSVDLSKGEYYCMYDPESGYDNVKTYPAPSEAIPSSHYMQTYRYGLGSAWPYSTSAPAFCILENKGIEAHVQNTDNYDYTESTTLPNVKIQVEWVMDGIEVFSTTSDKNQKRLTSEIDNGSVFMTGKLGYTLYRNVDKEATEAIEGNKDKLVYNYSMGTQDVEGSTDPSGIDAEASIKNGAKIIYKDTNNSTSDFHQRKQSSLK